MGNCDSSEVNIPASVTPLSLHEIQHPSNNVENSPSTLSQAQNIPPESSCVQQENPPSQPTNTLSPLIPLIQGGQISVKSLQHNLRDSLPKLIQISQKAKDIKNSLLTNFSIGKELFDMLNGVCFTESQGKDLAKALINGVIILQKPQPSEQKAIIKALFSEINIKMITNQKLYYYQMLDKLKNQKVSQSQKSRIYHTIANIKKDKNFERKWQYNHSIQCIQTIDYKQLSELELQQVVNYETIADKVREMGEKIGFKFQSIKKQSQKVINLLTKCINNNIQYINQLKYDLSENEVMKMASISRQACNYYDNGVYVLLVYLVQSCKRLEKQSKSTEEIEKLLKKAIGDISIKYPPGQSLSRQHEGLIKTLKQLQNPKNYNKVEFQHDQIKLTSTNKQQQVEQIITKYAKIAEESKQLFQEIVKTTCLAKCVYFKIGLKYYPNKPNIKALTRIKEKMFFKKDAKQSGKRISGSKINEILEKEETAYRKIIDEILKSTDSVQFKISDMVRGKCVFLEVADIIESVNEIKKLAAKNPQIGIKQIESRFTNPMPISDVTLKIVLNNQIVAELQLTIQTNAATYNFAHKIYQLQRSKVFSKLKITHNYFQEYYEDFSELAKKAIELEIPKSTITLPTSKSISQYFKLDINPKLFPTILQEEVQQSKQLIKQLSISVDPLLQDLINTAFNISIGRWNKLIGNIINKALQNDQLSSKMKSVIMSIFLNQFQLPNEVYQMQQFGLPKESMKEVIYIEEYLKEYFQIQSPLKFIKENQRVFCRAQQLMQIYFFIYDTYPIRLNQITFVENLVIESLCQQKIQKLKELFYFQFLAKYENKYHQKMFFDYFKWISNVLDQKNNTETQILKAQIQIIKAQMHLDKLQPKQAVIILQNCLKLFKSREEHSKVMECQILLAQSFIFANQQLSLQQCIDYYNSVKQKAQILGLQLKGILYANSLWRISECLWKRIKDKQQQILLLKTYTLMAIEQLSGIKGASFIYDLVKRWKYYDMHNISKPKIKENLNVRYARLLDIQSDQFQCLSIVS